MNDNTMSERDSQKTNISWRCKGIGSCGEALSLTYRTAISHEIRIAISSSSHRLLCVIILLIYFLNLSSSQCRLSIVRCHGYVLRHLSVFFSSLNLFVVYSNPVRNQALIVLQTILLFINVYRSLIGGMQAGYSLWC